MARVRADRDAMKIEHWHSQSGHPQEQLDYTNLLASCMGNDGRYNAERYCDSSKGERELSRNRANPLHAVESLTHFLGDGRIASSNHAFEAELNQVLNLNVSYLVNSRKGVLTAFQAAMGKRELSQAVLQKWLEDWDGESKSGDLRPFCGVVVYWLRKRLART